MTESDFREKLKALCIEYDRNHKLVLSAWPGADVYSFYVKNEQKLRIKNANH